MEETFVFQVLMAHLIAAPAFLIAATHLLRERRIRAMLMKPPGTVILPSAEETRRSVVRFREAARRHEMLDFVWERWLRSRTLFFR